ncbi:MAG: ABC transporter substrate-binding protein [Cyanobium sp.]
MPPSTVHVRRWPLAGVLRQAMCPAISGLLLTLGGCRTAPQELTVPISSWPGYEYLHLAREKGFDRLENLSLKLVAFPDPQEIVHAYLRGELAIAQLTTVEAVDLCARLPKRCPVVVLVLDESLGADQVVARNDIDDIADLRHQPVAVTPSTLGPYVLSRALESRGLQLEDVQIRPMPLGAMAESLRRGEVAGAALFPPFSDEALRDGQNRTLFTSREIPGEILDVLVVEPRLLASRPEAIAHLLRAWARAHHYADRQPRDAINRMARRERVTPEAFHLSLQGLGFRTLAEQQPLFRAHGALEANLRSVQRVQIGLGLMEAAPLPTVDGAPLRQALAGSPLSP